MRTIQILVGAILVALIGSISAATADGIPFKGNRVDAPTTVLVLTQAQQITIKRTPPRKLPYIRLTPEQRALIKRDTAFAPDVIEVWDLAGAKDACTCEALNVGVQCRRDRVEVIHYLLGKDLQDRGHHGARSKRLYRKG